MPLLSYRSRILRVYLAYMVLRDSIRPPEATPDIYALAKQLEIDLKIIEGIKKTRYLQSRPPVIKAGNLHLAWVYAQNPADHDRFINMLRVSPAVFEVLLHLIEEHPIFSNNSNNPQKPVQAQLAVTLYRMGCYGNGASLEDIARIAGCSEGDIVNATAHCFEATESLHDIFVHPLTGDEKEVEKRWVDQHLGFQGSWRDGWVMYDGTIVVLHARPGLNGDAYFTRKSNYGLNLQVCPCARMSNG